MYMLPEQQAAQLYGVGRLVQSVRSLLQLQLEQSLHPGQLKLEKQSSVTIFPTLNITVQTKSHYYIVQNLEEIKSDNLLHHCKVLKLCLFFLQT